MSIHTLAFAGNVDFSSGPQEIPAVQDDVIAATSSSSFVLQQGYKMLAAYGGGDQLVEARVIAPSLQRVTFPRIRPLDSAPKPPSDPNFMRDLDNPVQLDASDAISLQANSDAGSAIDVAFLLWFEDGEPEPTPPGESFWVRFEANNLAANKFEWDSTSVTLTDRIPNGVYAVLGFEVIGSAAVAARLVFPNQPLRPGTLGQSDETDRGPEFIYDGSLGVLGTFESFAPPNIEVLQGASPQGSVTGHARVVRVGDATAPGQRPSPDRRRRR